MKKQCGRKLRLENLESRQMMAGNVAVSVSGGDLVVVGDNQPNEVSIYQKSPGSGTWYVDGFQQGGRDTTVNRRTGPQVFHGVRDDVRVYLNGGSDAVTLKNGKVPDELYVRTHSGNDYVWIENVSTRRDVNVDLGSSSSNTREDYLHMQRVTAGDDILVEGSRGRDVVIMDNVMAEDLIRARTGSGDDFVRASRSEADRFFADLGSGKDKIELQQDDFDYSWVYGGSGSDQLTLKNRGGSLGRLTRSSIGTKYA